jgi:DUF438 domain-containing protein/uncharacterized protein (DUF2249 family)
MTKEWMQLIQEFETLDARGADPGNFLPMVAQKAQGLPAGQGLHIIQSFEPVPLYPILEGIGFQRETVQDDAGDFHIYFYKPITAPTEEEVQESKQISEEMRRHLQVDEQRINAIVDIVKAFYEGEDIAVLQAHFDRELGSISPAEFAFVEQKMTEIGISDDLFKARVEDLLKIFKKSLSQVQTPDFPPGHPIHTFKKENEALAALVEEINRLLAKGMRNPELWLALLDRLWQVDIHYVRKENQLFPRLEQKGFDKPSKVMWALHDDVRAAIKEARRQLASGDWDVFRSALDKALDGVVDMIFKENKILWPTSIAMLTPAEWEEVRRGEEEIGYCLIEPPPPWSSATTHQQVETTPVRPESAASRPRAKAKPFRGGKKPKAVAVGAIGLEEGYLTPEQISLVLQHLPLDIVFVDAYDEVVYANHGERRSIAQREVVDAFKAAQKDEAEFWRAENGRYFYIKFIAIRDDDGEYQGYLQVQQDITEIRQLKGEKRILDWE